MTTTHQTLRNSSTFSARQPDSLQGRPFWRIVSLTTAVLLALVVAFGPVGSPLLRTLSLAAAPLALWLAVSEILLFRRRVNWQRRSELLRRLADPNRLEVEAALEELRAKKWLCDGALEGVDLHEIDLKNLNLVAASLVGAHLFRADLSGANLSEALLCNAQLTEADLKLANFFQADLRGADLRMADLRRAYLRQADLRGADLRLADLSLAEITKSLLVEADLFKANLAGAQLIKVDLRGANLSGADLRGADLRGADLRHARFERANLTGANLAGARLEGALVTTHQLQQAATLQGVILPNGLAADARPPHSTPVEPVPEEIEAAALISLKQSKRSLRALLLAPAPGSD